MGYEALYKEIYTQLSVAKHQDRWDESAVIADPGLEAFAIMWKAKELSERCGDSLEATARRFAEQRASGELLGRVLGCVEFMGIEIQTAPDCLVPRCETELLASQAIDLLTGLDTSSPIVIDLGCGVGNIGCTIACHVPGAIVYMSDLTPACVRAAQANVDRLGLAERIQVLQGDLFAPFVGLGLDKRVDLIVCNPPYISTGSLGAERAPLLDREPREAFDGGPYGLNIHQKVISGSVQFLKDEGWLAFEFGLGQERQLQLLFKRAKSIYQDPVMKKNDAGVARVAISQRRPEET